VALRTPKLTLSLAALVVSEIDAIFTWRRSRPLDNEPWRQALFHLLIRSIHRARIRLPAFTETDFTGSFGLLCTDVMHHYIAGLKANIPSLVSSNDLLGPAAGFVGSAVAGVYDLASSPGPRGVASLAHWLVHGSVNVVRAAAAQGLSLITRPGLAQSRTQEVAKGEMDAASAGVSPVNNRSRSIDSDITTIDGLDTVSSSGLSHGSGTTGSLGFRQPRPEKDQAAYATVVPAARSSWLCEDFVSVKQYAANFASTSAAQTIDATVKTFGAAGATLVFDIEQFFKFAPDVSMRDLGCVIAGLQLRVYFPALLPTPELNVAGEPDAELQGGDRAAALLTAVRHGLRATELHTACATFEKMVALYPDAARNPVRLVDVRRLYADFIRTEARASDRKTDMSAPLLRSAPARATPAQRNALRYVKTYLGSVLERFQHDTGAG
jgi:hypothetical protein